MNPYIIIGALILAAAALFGAYQKGYSGGIAEQKIADQAQFDKINAALTKQKAEAATIYQDAQADIIALQIQRDAFKIKLERDHANNEIATAALRDKLAGLSLRFSALKATGGGTGGGNATSSGDHPAGTAGTTIIQLPEKIAGDLRRLAYDADELNDDYRLAYDFAHKIKCK